MMTCDFAIAGTTARFGQAEVKIGVMAGMGGTQRMTRHRLFSFHEHSSDRANDGRSRGAAGAGLVARVVPDDEVLRAAMAAARTIASYSHAVSSGRAKRNSLGA